MSIFLIKNLVSKLSNINKTRTKKYVLSQFPYPSGDLHLGHARVYYIGDSIATYYRMQGHQVIYPIGWDSFGLPAQNAAILHKKNPKQWTINNIEKMKQQLKHLDVNFNWEMQLSTSEPQYYRWTQQIFVKMFKKGLAYKKLAQVNWDPVDKTVLANEQVDDNGCSWRSGAKVEKKELNQWFLKITGFAQQLQNELQKLEWVQKVKNMQKGWIQFDKKSRITLKLKTKDIGHNRPKTIDVYYKNKQNWKNCMFIIRKGKNIINSESGCQIIGYTESPFYTRMIPVVEANQESQTQFQISNGRGNSLHQKIVKLFDFKIGGVHKGIKLTQEEIHSIEQIKQMKLRDWLISRQRYWGCPIPIIYCNQCGVLPVPENQLPVLLPQWKNQGNPLTKQQFIKCQCPSCGKPAKRQSDTMDTFMDSSWYFLRFMDNKNTKKIFSLQNVVKMMPVDVYIGGIQHAIMHLLYARFIMKFISNQYDLPQHCRQPFKQLVVQGLVKGKTLKLIQNNRYISAEELQSGKYKLDEVSVTYQKMSKSKFNGLNPNAIVDKYGSDALRTSIFFANPPDRDIDFNQDIVINADKFLKKIDEVWKKIQNLQINKSQIPNAFFQNQLSLKLKIIFEKMENSIQKRLLHTYVANTMEMFNLIKESIIQTSEKKLSNVEKIKLFSIFIRILQVIAPKTANSYKKLLNSKFQILNDFEYNCWPSQQLFGNQTKILIRKGNKVLGEAIIKVSMSDQQIRKELKLEHETVEIKRFRQNFILIIKQTTTKK